MTVKPHATIALVFVPGQLQEETMRACAGVQRFVELCRTPAREPGAYARHLIRLWETPGDLIVLEQDKVPPSGWFPELRRCDFELCVYPYDLGGRLCMRGLGVCRFSAALKARYPDAMSKACSADGSGRGVRSWRSLDVSIHAWFDRHNVDRHIHTPPAMHLHQLELFHA